VKTGGYLLLWLAIFLVAFLNADTALPWLVKTLDPLSPVWVAMLSWLPLGFIMVATALAKPPERGDFSPRLAAAAALPGLAIAAQLPLIIRGGRPSAEYVAASVTDTGTAFGSGFLWGAGLVLLWGVFFFVLVLRRDVAQPGRIFAIGALVASLIGLTLSVITL
jgi:hypothetical protein